MISAVFIVNSRGELLIQRHYKDNITKSAINAFRQRVIAAKQFTSPIVQMDKCSFLFVKEGDLFLCAVTRQNANPALVFQFLYQMTTVLKAYFGAKLDEDMLKNNFVLIFELLDEMMDHGYPQVTAVNMLSSVIKNGSVKENVSNVPEGDSSSITAELTGAVDWRQAGKYVYKKNEVFIDALESVNLIMSSKGAVLRKDVSGKVMMKTYLTGMPECKFSMNEKMSMEHEAKKNRKKRFNSGITLDDCTFHRCVNLAHFDHDRTISFIPPDGEFELMKYRITQHVKLPFRVIPVVTEHGRSRVEYEISVKGDFGKDCTANDVVVNIPAPANAAKCKLKANGGKATYIPAEHLIRWKFKKFHGDHQYRLLGDVKLVQSMNESQWTRPPITMNFTLIQFTASLLHIRSLKIYEKGDYDTVKWVRYLTKAGQYEIRI